MAYLNGTFQYFDNSFLYETKDYNKPTKIEYDPTTLLGYIFYNHPKWYLILQKADRLTYFEKGYFSLWTMFIPEESMITILDIENMDRNTALKIFNLHVLPGFFNKAILQTSRYQELNTLTDGKMLELYCIDDIFVIDKRSKIIHFDIIYENVVMHIISHLL
jgi:hypothetical protein